MADYAVIDTINGFGFAGTGINKIDRNNGANREPDIFSNMACYVPAVSGFVFSVVLGGFRW